ncbi:response regulator [Novosphingobium sp. Leaf2]|uniref:response regulator n=1 Tax=Novosphingobium sp. Leaf2 TaxID=1735670 RepID=UPI0006F78BE9|nr:response regulator [Novosphingobium sp. Leaf2]KQM19443.1 histidine kinase [Novosphingobium sp. Leaf2]
MSEQSSKFEGMRVLVAEDEFLVSMLLEEMLDDLGCTVVGPYAELSAALEGVRAAEFDVAVIDLNLAGEKADPIIHELAARAVPFAIASGGSDTQTGQTPTALLNKPYSSAELEETVHALHAALRGNA